MHNLPFPNSQFTASAPFELVHSDLWGLAPVNFVNGFRYYILFVDHYSRFSWLYLLKSKTEAFSKFVHFMPWLRLNFLPLLNVLDQMVVENLLLMSLSPICHNMVYLIICLALTLHSKMEWLKESTGMLLRQL